MTMTALTISIILRRNQFPLTAVALNSGKMIPREFDRFSIQFSEDTTLPVESGYYVCQIIGKTINKRGNVVHVVRDFHLIDENLFNMENLRQARLGTWFGAQVLLETCSHFLSVEEKLALASGNFDRKLHDNVFNLCLAQLVTLSDDQPLF